MKKRIITSVLVAAAAASMACAASAADVTIKLATTKVSGSYAIEGLEAMAEKIAADSDGAIEVQVYPDSQLGIVGQFSRQI